MPRKDDFPIKMLVLGASVVGVAVVAAVAFALVVHWRAPRKPVLGSGDTTAAAVSLALPDSAGVEPGSPVVAQPAPPGQSLPQAPAPVAPPATYAAPAAETPAGSPAPPMTPAPAAAGPMPAMGGAMPAPMPASRATPRRRLRRAAPDTAAPDSSAPPAPTAVPAPTPRADTVAARRPRPDTGRTPRPDSTSVR